MTERPLTGPQGSIRLHPAAPGDVCRRAALVRAPASSAPAIALLVRARRARGEAGLIVGNKRSLRPGTKPGSSLSRLQGTPDQRSGIDSIMAPTSRSSADRVRSRPYDPQTRTSTSPGPGDGVAISRGSNTSGPPKRVTTMARMNGSPVVGGRRPARCRATVPTRRGRGPAPCAARRRDRSPRPGCPPPWRRGRARGPGP